MEATKITEKMPEFVKGTIGEAQKRLTLLEGQARQLVNGTWTKIIANPSIQAVETRISALKKTYEVILDVEKLRKRAEDVSNEYTVRAFHSVGLATQRDIKQVERKIDRIRTDLRNINRRPKNRAQTQGKTQAQAANKTAPKAKRNNRSRKPSTRRAQTAK